MNSLNIVHFNPDGIRGRQTNILNYIDQENTHIIAVSETHLKPSRHFSLGNFIPIRKDRTERRKGGVAFFINNKIEFTVNDWFNKYNRLLFKTGFIKFRIFAFRLPVPVSFV